MSKKLNMGKKLVSLFCLGLSLMGGFTLVGASAPRKGKAKSLSPNEIFSILQACDESNIQSMIAEGKLDVVFQSSNGPQSVLKILTFSGFAFSNEKRCMIARGLLNAGASSEEISEALASAVVEGNTELFQTIFDHPNCFVPVDFIFPYAPQPTTLLLMAIQEGHLSMVKFLVKRGADIDSRVGTRTPWMWARWGNQQEIMRFLESCGATTYKLIGSGLSQRFDVDYSSLKDLAAQNCAQDDGGSHDAGPRAGSGSGHAQAGARNAGEDWSADKVATVKKMMIAADNGDLASLKEILDADTTFIDTMVPHSYDGSRYNVLGVAITRQDCAMISYLLGKGARWDQELDFGTGGMGYVPIVSLAVSNPKIMNCFFKAGMRVDHKFGDTTLLKKAAYFGLTKMVEFLLENGAQREKTQAAFLAAERGHADVVKLLCKNDPSIIKRPLDQDGIYTNLLISAIRGQQENIVFHLLTLPREQRPDFSYGSHGGCAELIEAKRTKNKRIIGLVEMYMKKRMAEAKAAPDRERERIAAFDAIARLEAQRAASLEKQLEVQRVASLEAKDEELRKREKRLGAAADLLRPRTKVAQAENQEQPDPEPEQAAEQVKNKKKKKNKIERKYDGGPVQVESDDSAAWELCAQWVQEQEATVKSAELVQAVKNFNATKNHETHDALHNLLGQGYVLYGQDAQDYALEYDNAYSRLYPERAKQRRVKAAPTSASSGKQQEAKSAGARKNKGQKNGGQNRGAGKKAKRPEKKSHIPEQPGRERRVLNPAIAKAPSMYDHLLYAAGYVEDDGQPKQQVGDYVPEQAETQLDDGGPRYSDDGGAVQAYGDGGEQYPGEFAPDDSDAKRQAELAAPLVRISLRAGGEMVWHRKHAMTINLEDESGLHLDPDNELEIANNLERRDVAISREGNECYALLVLGKIKSMFPSKWTVQSFTNRFVRAIQDDNYTETNEKYQAKSGRTRKRRVLVGIMDPADYEGADFNKERPVPWMARMLGNTNEIGTVFPITTKQYHKFASMGQNAEEKDDQLLSFESGDADAQAGEDEQYESVWD